MPLLSSNLIASESYDSNLDSAVAHGIPVRVFESRREHMVNMHLIQRAADLFLPGLDAQNILTIRCCHGLGVSTRTHDEYL